MKPIIYVEPLPCLMGDSPRYVAHSHVFVLDCELPVMSQVCESIAASVDDLLNRAAPAFEGVDFQVTIGAPPREEVNR